MHDLLSDRVSSIEESQTIALAQRARQLKLSGSDVINLCVGETDFPIPEHVKDSAIKAISDKNSNKYTPVNGIEQLREAIVTKFAKENNLEYNIDQISLGSGGKQVIFNALLATLNKNDEVIIIAPYWVSYPEMVKLTGGTPIIVSGELTSDGLKIDIEKLESKITKKTKWIILNSPSNPTGTIFTFQDLKEMAGVLLKHPKINIMSDDIYEHILYDDEKFYNILNVEPKLYDRTLVVNGLSKAYAMTGWRVGFGAGGNPDLIKGMSKIQSQSTYHICAMAQHAAVAALQGEKKFIYERKLILKENRDVLISYINKTKHLKAYVPKGAFYLFVSCQECIGKKTSSGQVINNDLDYVRILLEEEGVAVVNGNTFGASPYFRISYALSKEKLTQACQRVLRFCEKLID